MSNHRSGPKNTKIVSLFITFAILFIVVFGLGVIIGKGLGGSDTPSIDRSYKIETPEVEEYGAIDIESEEDDSLSSESEVVILDEEDETSIDKQSNEALGQDNTEQKSVAKTPSKTPVPDKVSDKQEKVEPKKEKATATQKPAQVAVEKTPPTQKPNPKDSSKIDPNGRYTVQIGAFRNLAEANKLVSSLKSKGYPAFLKEVDSPDKKSWYKVRVGTFATRPDAISYGDNLKQKVSGVKYLFITVNN